MFVENIFIGLMKRFGRRLLSMVVGICPLSQEDLMTVSWCLSRVILETDPANGGPDGGQGEAPVDRRGAIRLAGPHR